MRFDKPLGYDEVEAGGEYTHRGMTRHRQAENLRRLS